MAETDKKEDDASDPQADADQQVADALSQVKAGIDEMRAEADSAGGAAPMDLPDLRGEGVGGNPEAAGIELLSDVDLRVTIELGRTEMLVEDVLRLNEGSVVELDKLAGDPVDVYVNNRLIARGEVLVLNDNFCIRVSEIVANLEDEAGAAHEETVAQSNKEAKK